MSRDFDLCLIVDLDIGVNTKFGRYIFYTSRKSECTCLPCFNHFLSLQGMVDAGEKVSVTLKREFGEEAMNSLDAQKDDKKKIKKDVDTLFKSGQEVRR